MTDYKNFRAPSIWPLVWGAILAACFVAAMVIPDNAERQGDRVNQGAAVIAVPMSLSVSAPYTPCPKSAKRGGSYKPLRFEIAQQTKQGWVITCSYDGDNLMTREELKL